MSNLGKTVSNPMMTDEVEQKPEVLVAPKHGDWISEHKDAQKRHKDPDYCRGKIDHYNERLHPKGRTKGQQKANLKHHPKEFSNAFEMIITDDAQRKKYMGLEWSSDVYRTQNQLNLLGTATFEYETYHKKAKWLQRVGDMLFLIIALCGALTPTIIAVSALWPQVKWLKQALDGVAIGLSIAGTISAMVVQQYKFSDRAMIMEDGANQISDLCHSFCSLTGHIFDPKNDTIDKYYHNQTIGAPSKGYTIPSFDGIPIAVLQIAVKTHVDAVEKAQAGTNVGSLDEYGNRMTSEHGGTGDGRGAGGARPMRHNFNFKLFALEYHRLSNRIDMDVAKLVGKHAVLTQ